MGSGKIEIISRCCLERGLLNSSKWYFTRKKRAQENVKIILKTQSSNKLNRVNANSQLAFPITCCLDIWPNTSSNTALQNAYSSKCSSKMYRALSLTTKQYYVLFCFVSSLNICILYIGYGTLQCVRYS